jgi:CRISPR-associated protein Csb1
MKIEAHRLAAACGDSADDSGISISTVLEPLAGRDAPVKPAVYAGDLFQEDWRWWGDPAEKTRAIVIDNTPSQANRLEAALERLAPVLGLPTVELDLDSITTLPAHLPRHLSGFRFPHRHADAYLRDSVLDGEPLAQTKIGRGLFDATADRPLVILQWFPQALLFGFWQSHLGKKRSQAKLARSWVSEIVGYDPANPDGAHTRVLGLKGDPLNLSIDEPASYDTDDILAGWEIQADSQKSGRSKQGESLAELGHGQVPFKGSEAALGAVSFAAIEHGSTVSFAGLRRLYFGDDATNSAARALLVAVGLAAHTAAFGRGFTLRSGCDLRPVDTDWRWLTASKAEALAPLTAAEAVDLVIACRDQARDVGLLDGGG